MTDGIDGDIVDGELSVIDMAGFNLPEPVAFKEKLEGVFAQMYAKIDADLAARVVDLTTDKGRKQIASDARKISSLKVKMAEKAGELVADQKAIIQTVTKTRQEMEAEFDKRRDIARAPLTLWEETTRVIEDRAKSERAFMLTIRAQNIGGVMVADMGSVQLASLRSMRADMTFTAEEYGDAASDLDALNRTTIAWMDDAIRTAIKAEADAAELEELRAIKAERDAREEKERQEAEAKAESARQAAQDEADRIQREADEAARKIAEEKRIAAAAEASSKARIEAAEEASRQAIEKAKSDAEAEIKRAKDVQLAKEAADAKRVAEQAAETKRREEDKEHRRAINLEVVAALVAAGLSDDQAKVVVIAISKGQVPHTSIKY